MTADEVHPAARPGTSPASTEELADAALAAEIELYADVVVAASESEGPIRGGDLDRALGIVAWTTRPVLPPPG
ncbi:hypothetical protein ACFFKU_16025 [Kineococcus gynurae]|uniref:DUF222 domain-containing protein n=1 Tax=Kineococcus gynurae TaxID=452979 RepID=A0ABV5LPM0_9ACTN